MSNLLSYASTVIIESDGKLWSYSDAHTLHKFFDEKVDGVRAATADAPPPTFVPIREGCSLNAFRLVTVDVVIAAVNALPNKQCVSDPLPTSWLKGNVDLLAPFLVELFNQSLTMGYVPTAFREAYITPILKKADLDSFDAKSYRPISNLSVLSKLLERLVARQLPFQHYKTIGLIIICLGLCLPRIAFLHMLTDGLFKALLFITAGSLITLNNQIKSNKINLGD